MVRVAIASEVGDRVGFASHEFAAGDELAIPGDGGCAEQGLAGHVDAGAGQQGSKVLRAARRRPAERQRIRVVIDVEAALGAHEIVGAGRADDDLAIAADGVGDHRVLASERRQDGHATCGRPAHRLRARPLRRAAHNHRTIKVDREAARRVESVGWIEIGHHACIETGRYHPSEGVLLGDAARRHVGHAGHDAPVGVGSVGCRMTGRSVERAKIGHRAVGTRPAKGGEAGDDAWRRGASHDHGGVVADAKSLGREPPWQRAKIDGAARQRPLDGVEGSGVAGIRVANSCQFGSEAERRDVGRVIRTRAKRLHVAVRRIMKIVLIYDTGDLP